MRRRTQTDICGGPFVVVVQEGRRGTQFCYPGQSMKRTEGRRFSLELGERRLEEEGEE
jgi:hypothetical protein